MRDDDLITCLHHGPQHKKMMRACSFCMKQPDCKNFKQYMKENGIMKDGKSKEAISKDVEVKKSAEVVDKDTAAEVLTTIQDDHADETKLPAEEEVKEPKLHIEKSKSYLTYKFTDGELAFLSKEMAGKYVELQEKEGHKKSVVKQLDADISMVEAEVKSLSNKVNNGYEMRNVDVELRFDFDHRVKNMFRMDTGDFVKQIPLTNDEMQLNLPIEPATVLHLVKEDETKKEDEKVEPKKEEEKKEVVVKENENN